MIDLLPLDMLLLEYAAGSLNSAEGLVVAAHMSLNPAARKKVSAYEAMGGEILRETDPADLCADCLDKVLHQIAQPEKTKNTATTSTTPSPTRARDIGVSPELYALICSVCREDGACWGSMARGIELMDLHLKSSCVSKGRLRLMRMSPREATPRHAHKGREITLVLEGGYSDDFGHYSKGDIAFIIGQESSHSPVADAEGCLCLTYTEAPLCFDDRVRRILNVFRAI